jgi:hypothetical protein
LLRQGRRSAPCPRSPPRHVVKISRIDCSAPRGILIPRGLWPSFDAGLACAAQTAGCDAAGGPQFTRDLANALLIGSNQSQASCLPIAP